MARLVPSRLIMFRLSRIALSHSPSIRHRGDELLPCLGLVVGNDVQQVRLATSRHADIDTGGAGRVGEDRVRPVRGCALHPVRSRRIRKMRMLGYIVCGEAHGARNLPPARPW